MSGFVGVMDSGVGGLSVLQNLQAVCNCNFVYFADHAYCPYGTKSLRQIFRRVVRVAQYLQSSGASAIVLACNTASVFANELRNLLPLPVCDVIEPTCLAVLQTTLSKRVALLATNATVKSGVYPRLLAQNGITVVPFACSSFVPLVEGGIAPNLCQQTVESCLKLLPQSNVDTVILGCTHFPFLLPQISSCCGNAKIVSCSQAVVSAFCQTVQQQGNGQTTYFTTGQNFVCNVTGTPITFRHVEL